MLQACEALRHLLHLALPPVLASFAAAPGIADVMQRSCYSTWDCVEISTGGWFSDKALLAAAQAQAVQDTPAALDSFLCSPTQLIEQLTSIWCLCKCLYGARSVEWTAQHAVLLSCSMSGMFC